MELLFGDFRTCGTIKRIDKYCAPYAYLKFMPGEPSLRISVERKESARGLAYGNIEAWAIEHPRIAAIVWLSGKKHKNWLCPRYYQLVFYT